MTNGHGNRPPSKRPIRIVVGILLIILVIVAVQGLVRGGGEAAGIEGAAPGGTNAEEAGQDKKG